MEIPYLRKYASFLLENHLDELVATNIKKAYEMNIPLLKFFKGFSEQQLFEFSKQDFVKFLSGIIQGRAEEEVRLNALLWKQNNISIIERNDINPKDIVLTPYVRKHALLSFLEYYSQNVKEYIEVVKDIEKYFAFELETTVTTYSEIQQEILRSEKEFNRLVIETTNDSITAFDKNVNITVWNKAVEKTTGITRDEILGKNMFMVFPDYENTENGKAVKEAVGGKHLKLTNQPYQHKEGYYEIEIVPIKNEDGEVLGGITFSRDITERKKVEEIIDKKNKDLQQLNEALLKEVEERKSTEKQLIREKGFSKTLVDSQVNGIVALDNELRYTEWNSFMESLIGKKAKDVIGKKILDVFPGTENSENYIAFQEALKGETTVLLDRKYRTREGSYNAYIMPVYDEIGNINGVLSLTNDITQQKQVEKDLIKSRHFFQKVMDIVPEIISVFDVHTGQYLFINEAVEEILGYTPQSILNENINVLKGLTHPDDLQEVEQKIAKAIEKANSGNLISSELMRFEHRVMHKNEGYRWLKTLGTVFETDADNKVTAILIVSIDITKRKLTEARLAETQQFIEKIADIAPYPIAVMDIKKQLPIYVNRESLRILGYTDEEIKQKNAQDLINAVVHPDDMDKLIERQQKIPFMSDEDELETEYRLLDKDSNWIWLLSKVKAFKRDNHGQVEQYISVSVNITEKKLHELEMAEKNYDLSAALEELRSAEESLQELNYNLEKKVIARTEELASSEEELRQTLDKAIELNEALAANEQQIRLITDSLPVLISYVNHEEKYSFINKAYVDWFKTSKEQILGKTLREIGGEKVYENVSKKMKLALQGERQEFEAKLDYNEAGSKYMHINYIPDINQGKVKGFYALVTDVTQRKQNEIELEKALNDSKKFNSELQKINEILDNFIHMAAHDLRAPVANLRSLMHMINKTADELKKKQLFTAVTTSIERLDNTINGLVEVVEVQSKSPSLVKVVGFEHVFNIINEEVSDQLKSVNGKIILNLNAPTINYIEPYLECIMRNLISNSIKYHSEERPLQIRVNTEKEKGFILLKIEDTGIGMDLDRYGRNLFKPFTRFSKNTEGKGIGLHLVKSIVEKNGGCVAVKSSLDKGTTFEIYLKEYEN